MQSTTKSMSERLVAGAMVCALLAAPATLACVEGEVRGEAVNAERDAGRMAAGEEATMQVVGAGWFHAVEVVKRGGTSDQTSVTLELDGEPMLSTSFATLKNKWMQLSTANIIANVTARGGEDVLTVWYTPDLKFNTRALVRVGVEEDGVDDLRVRAVLSRALPHSHPGGQAGALASLPAFK